MQIVLVWRRLNSHTSQFWFSHGTHEVKLLWTYPGAQTVQFVLQIVHVKFDYRLYPEIQLKQTLGVDGRQLLQGEVQPCEQRPAFSKYPDLQTVQRVAEVQISQVLGQDEQVPLKVRYVPYRQAVHLDTFIHVLHSAKHFWHLLVLA